MKFDKLEDIIAWQKARSLTVAIYETFNEIRDFGFKDQIEKAGISFMNNIAEGYERRTNREFVYFLFVAKGSCGEVRSMLYLAHDLKMIGDKEFDSRYSISIEISCLLSGLIKSLHNK